MKKKSRQRPSRPRTANPAAPVVERPSAVSSQMAPPPVSITARFRSLLARPVSGASLAVFRFAAGLIMALEAWALCRPSPDAISSGNSPLTTYYVGPDIKFHFPYEGFQWLSMLPPGGIYALIALQAVAGVMMAIGLWYRASAALVFLAWGYLFAIESTRTYWQSHYYLELLVTFLLIWMPAARVYSVDQWLARDSRKTGTVPYWTILLLRAQLVIAYFYAGVAKLNADWLLDAVPLRWYLERPGVTAPFQKHLSPAHFDTFRTLVHSAPFAYFLSYTGAIFDLTVGFLLLIRRTRIFAMILMVVFHATNHFLIFDDIGWFPLLGLATALIFLDPDWPERSLAWVRRPRFAKPDWGWLAGGAAAFPIVGAALGWKLQPSARASPAPQAVPLGRGVVPFVGLWLVWQILTPLRQYWIPGDGRFTYEGLSFSWRLKTDVHHAAAAQLRIDDSAIVPRNGPDAGRINWAAWHGERVIYRQGGPRLNWRDLPEVVVILEPIIGDRIVYNPFAGVDTPRTEPESRRRVTQIWQELHGRDPDGIDVSLPALGLLESLPTALRAGGNPAEAAELTGLLSQIGRIEANSGQAGDEKVFRAVLVDLLKRLSARDVAGNVSRGLRHIDPFGLAGGRTSHFLLIKDSRLLRESKGHRYRVDRTYWRNDLYTGTDRGVLDGGAQPMVVYLGEIGAEAKEVLPQAYLESRGPGQSTEIYWNTLQDVTSSKLMHLSNQAFYLRRYARRVADLWNQEYGRRPAVRAITAVSLNGRPHQPLVDPDADLASVPVKALGHNAWILDLQMPRIPRAAVTNGLQFVGP